MVKIIHNSGNLYVRIPKEIISASGFKQGDELLIQYSRESEMITAKRLEKK
jgi:antitoxin component of MazEF toxin-antitoxin module